MEADPRNLCHTHTKHVWHEIQVAVVVVVAVGRGLMEISHRKHPGCLDIAFFLSTLVVVVVVGSEDVAGGSRELLLTRSTSGRSSSHSKNSIFADLAPTRSTKTASDVHQPEVVGKLETLLCAVTLLLSLKRNTPHLTAYREGYDEGTECGTS